MTLATVEKMLANAIEDEKHLTKIDYHLGRVAAFRFALDLLRDVDDCASVSTVEADNETEIKND